MVHISGILLHSIPISTLWPIGGAIGPISKPCNMGQAAKASELLGRLRAASRGSVAGAPPRPMPTLTLPAPVQHYTAPPSGAPAAPAAPVVGAGAPVRRHARAAHAREHAALRAPCGALRALHQRAAQRGGVGPRRAGRRAERPPAGGAKRGAQRREVHAAPRGRRLPRGLRHRPSTKAYELTVALHLPSHAHSPKGRAEARARRLETKDKHDEARASQVLEYANATPAARPRRAPPPPPPARRRRGAPWPCSSLTWPRSRRGSPRGARAASTAAAKVRAPSRVLPAGAQPPRAARENAPRAHVRDAQHLKLLPSIWASRAGSEKQLGAHRRARWQMQRKQDAPAGGARARAPAPTGDPPYIVHWQSSVQSTSVERACPCVASFSAR